MVEQYPTELLPAQDAPLKENSHCQNHNPRTGGGRNTAEIRGIDIKIRIPKLRRIRKARHVGPQVNLYAFPDLNAFYEVHIELEQSRAIKRAKPDVAELAGHW